MRLTTTLAALMLTALPALAQDAVMSDAERDAFRAEVRAYLLENPEVLMEAIGVLEQRQAEAEIDRDLRLTQLNAAALFDDGYSFVGGNPDGDITIVEFIDYRCSFCRRAHPEVTELVATDGNIRIITKEYPILGEQSLLASRFAIATKLVAGDAAYKQISDGLMAMRQDVTPETLTALAEGFDLDALAIMERIGGEDVTQIITDTRNLGDRLQITGTPTFVVQDQMLRGYTPLAQMQQIVADIRDDS